MSRRPKATETELLARRDAMVALLAEGRTVKGAGREMGLTPGQASFVATRFDLEANPEAVLRAKVTAGRSPDRKSVV